VSRRRGNPSESLSALWYRGASNPKKEDVRAAVSSSSSQLALRQVVAFIDAELERAEARLLSDTTYELPAWSEHTADRIAEVRTLRLVRDMINGGIVGA